MKGETKARALPPFMPQLLAVIVDSTPDEQAVVSAIQLLNWWLGPKDPKGIDLIKAVLVNPAQPQRVTAGTTKDELSQITERGIKRALARLKARGWVTAQRSFGGAACYSLSTPEWGFKETYGRILDRMPDSIRARVAPMTGQGGLPFGPGWHNSEATGGHPNIKDKTNTQTTQTEKAPKASLGTPYLEAFGKHWTKKTGVPWTRESGAKQEVERIRQDVDLAAFEALAEAYFALPDADGYLAQRGWPLKGLTSWRWNQLRLAQVEAKPVAGPQAPQVVL